MDVSGTPEQSGPVVRLIFPEEKLPSDLYLKQDCGQNEPHAADLWTDLHLVDNNKSCINSSTGCQQTAELAFLAVGSEFGKPQSIPAPQVNSVCRIRFHFTEFKRMFYS